MNELNEDLHLVTGYTLVDITNTKEITGDSNPRNQQRNWETLKQVLGLRAQISIIAPPTMSTAELTTHKFGAEFVDSHSVWTFTFGVEKVAVYGEQFEVLKLDFNTVPITTGLSETAKITVPLFNASGDQRNIYFEYAQS